MGLLDDDAEILKKAEEQRKTKKPKISKKSGLNRFASLNKYSKKIDQAKSSKKKESQKPERITIPEKETTDKIVVKETIKVKNEPQKTGVTYENKVQNRVQQGSKQNSNNVLNKKPTENKEVTNKVLNKVQQDTKPGSKQYTDKISNLNNEDFVHSFKSLKSSVNLLSGNKKKLMHYFFNECKKSASTITPKFTKDYLAAVLNIKKETIRTVIQRLKKDNMILIHESKTGRDGWASFAIPNHIYKELVNEENNGSNIYRLEETVDKLVTKLGTEQDTNLSSSSSYIVNNRKQETTTEKNFLVLPQEWKNIEIPEICKNISFSEQHLRQIFHSKANDLSPEDVQDSLEHFSYDLMNNHIKPHIGPLGMIIGTLKGNEGRNGKAKREGQVYISQHFQAYENEEYERRKKAILEREKIMKEREEFELSEKAHKFLNNLNEEDKKIFLKPKKDIFELGTAAYERMLLGVIKDRIKFGKSLLLEDVKKEFLHF